MNTENRQARQEKDRSDDDRIFLGAAVLLAQFLAERQKAVSDIEMGRAIDDAIWLAGRLNDAVEVRREKIRINLAETYRPQ